MTIYRVYQHRQGSGKLWAVSDVASGMVSTRWGPYRSDGRMPFEKTRKGRASELAAQKTRKGYDYVGAFEYDESGRRCSSGSTESPTRRVLDGVALELVTPWELNSHTIAGCHDTILRWLYALAENTELIVTTPFGVAIGDWTLDVQKDLGMAARATTLQIPVDEPLPLLVMSALRSQLPEKFRKGYVLAFSNGEEVPVTAKGFFESEPFHQLFNIDAVMLEDLLTVVGLLAAKPDWSQAIASGSDWI
jgi:hypothetical protein